MALTYSPPGSLGSKLPNFKLTSVDGKSFSPSDFAGSVAQVYMFICNHCPYVKAIEDRLISLAHQYQGRPVQFVGICANSWDEYPEDHPDQLKKRWQDKKYGFPYLVDETQDTARAFGAVCTPDFFVFDRKGLLAYRGRLDDSWKDASQVKQQDLKAAIDLLLTDKAVPQNQKPSMGCSIKWN